MLLHGSKLRLHIFGLMGEEFLRIFRLNEFLGMIERGLYMRSVKLSAFVLTSLTLACIMFAAPSA